jgi:hypothetical protein
MRLPIRNTGERVLTIFVEPVCDQHEVPVGGEAIVCLEDGCPHSVDVSEDWITIWNEGTEASVEIVTESEKSVVEALRLARLWLHRLGGARAGEAIDNCVTDLEQRNGYVNARAQVFGAFFRGFRLKATEALPSSDKLPTWPGRADLAPAYHAGGTAAWLNYTARRSDAFPGPGIGPFDTDAVQSRFEHAETIRIARS